MTAHISKPFIHVEDSNGNPYVGAVLYVYQAGTTTLASIYSDTGLSVAVTNPLSGVNASNAAGNFPRVYITSGTYKLRAETSAGVLIWEYDNIDTGLTSGSGALAITAGGTGATTAASARTSLGAASQTDVDDLSADIATLSASLQNIVSIPQGRLTPTTATPIITTGVSAGTAIYYTPFIGNLVPIYDGSQYVLTEFAELTLTLNSNHLASAAYDCFIFNDSGTVRIVTGPAWNSAAAGSSARGTGAGTTELTRVSGLLVNANSMTGRNGATTYSISANRATFVGSILMDGTNGQLTCHTAHGQSRKFGISNAFNRVEIILSAGDTSGSTHNYDTGTLRPPSGDSANSAIVFTCLAESYIEAIYSQYVVIASNAQTPITGIGLNSITALTGQRGQASIGVGLSDTLIAKCTSPPLLGRNDFTMLEAGGGAATNTWHTAEASMKLTVRYLA